MLLGKGPVSFFCMWIFCRLDQEDPGPWDVLQPVPKMSLKALGVVMRKSSRTDTIQQANDRSRKVYKSESILLRCESKREIRERDTHPGVRVSVLYGLLLTRGQIIHYLRHDFLEAGFPAFFFFLPYLDPGSCHGTCHLGYVWFDPASCGFFGERCQLRPLTFPIAAHDFLFSSLHVSC